MFRLYLVLGTLIATPVLWLALAFWSEPLAWASLIVAVLGCIWFRITSFERTLKALSATRLQEDRVISAMKRAALRAKFPAETRLQFWVISRSEAEAWLWIRGSEYHFILSQGYLARAHEEQLVQLFESIQSTPLRKVKVENQLYALSLWWNALKGPNNAFRHWFISFWLYPLERVLKIAKIEA